MSELALQLIAENKKTQATTLDLGNCGLTEIPAEALDCAWIETLILSSMWWEDDVENKEEISQNSQNKGEANTITALPTTGLHWPLLKKLVFNDNQIADLSPIANLTNLQILSCYSNQVADLSPIANLTNLQELSCAYNQVADLSPIANLTNLQQLYCKSNQVADLSPIAKLTNLQQLSCSSNQIADLSPVAKLTNLQQLYCYSNQITDLSPIAKLTNLQHLSCHSNQVADLSPIAKLTNLQQLYCSSNQVADLSPIANLINLQELYCFSNQVADLSSIANLINLQQLNCSSNQVADLSPVAKLINLQQLNCSSNQVADLSPIANLINLQQLNCSSNQIADLSPIANLTNLQQLSCTSNQIAELSPVAKLTNLQLLYCASNQIADLSPIANFTNLQLLSCASNQVADLSPIANFTNLQLLYCSSNQIADLSPIANFINLQQLYCFSNQIADLSPIANLTNLQQLYCFSNQVADLSPVANLTKKGIPVKWQDFTEHYNEDTTNWQQRPAILVKDNPLDKSLIAAIKRGPKAVLKYFNKPKARLFEARVLVLGEPRAGKTTLRHKLKDTNADMPKNTESTKAFEIEVEPYKCAIEKSGETNKMTYHLWDFGGQDYYRLLHQLFVAEQSVYLIVTGTDANKHEEELDFWLETIQRLGKDKQGKYGPVILFQNPKNQRNDLNFTDLKKRYDFWQQPEQFVINLNAIGKDKTNAETKYFDQKELERFGHFKAYLEKSFCQIEHIGKDMPEDWIKIKKELDKKRSQNLISMEDFRSICAKKGINDANEQNDLLAIFRTLGFLFHYESRALEGMVILNSEWITDALYRVLDDAIVSQNQGWFVESDIKKTLTTPMNRMICWRYSAPWAFYFTTKAGRWKVWLS